MSRKRNRTLLVFALIIIALYVVIRIVPSLTGALTGTELIEYGNLEVYDEVTCYIVRDETVYTAAESGEMDFYILEGTQIKKGTELFAFTEDTEGDEEDGDKPDTKYLDLIENVKENAEKDEGHISQRKGVLSYHVDGYEDYFAVGKLTKLDKKETEDLDIDSVDIQRKTCRRGEPIYKIANNSVWHITFWVDKEAIPRYENGKQVTVKLGEEKIAATISNILETEDGWQIVLRTNRYYSGFATDRVVEGQILTTDISGLLVSNQCLTTKDGVVGVYVKTTTGEYAFTPVKVRATNGEKTVVAEGIYYDEDGELVNTVEIYDEVLTDPETEEVKNKQ